MKKNNRSITKILLNSKYVNNFTKLLLILNRLDYYEDYYIPNKKLLNLMKMNDKDNLNKLLKKIENENIIRILYKGRRRYFLFTDKDMIFSDELEKEYKKVELEDYNWLEDEEN